MQKIASSGEKLKSAGETVSPAGEKLLPITAAVIAVGVAAVKTASDFDASMSQVAAVSGATGEDFDKLRAKAREMGGEDLATTSDIVTDALTAFGLTAKDSGHFADILAAASSNANTNVSMMGETFKYCAPIAGALGFSAEDTAEAIGLMANAGIKSSQAGTSLRTIMNNLTGEVKISGKSIVWRCISRLEPTGQECHARTVNETVLENVVVQAINTLLGDKPTYQTQLQQNIAKVIRSAQQNTADGIDERLQELQKELLKKANNKETYDEIADEIFKLREQREKCTVDTAARDAQIARINELQDFIKQQPTHLEIFDEALVKRWLERIIV